MRPTVFIVSEGLVAPPRHGFQIHLLSLARALAPHVNVRAVCWAPERGAAAWGAWAESLPGDLDPDSYLRVIAPGPRTGSALARKAACWRRAQALIERESRPGDVLWIRELPTALLGIPAFTRWMKGRKQLTYLYDVASIIELEHSVARDLRFARFKVGIERWLRPRFDRVRTLGPCMAEFLVSCGVPPEKLLVAPVGADPPTQPRPQRDQLRRLLYLGSAEPWQGLEVLLAAMRSVEETHPHLRLSVAGVSPDTVAVFEPPSNVDALGWVTRDKIPALYRDHDLFVIPRPRMPLTDTVVPMKSVEAIVHGIPVLASRLRSIEEATGPGAAHFCEPGSSESLAASIRELADQPRMLASLGAAARERGPLLSWDAVGQKIVTELFPDPGVARE